jgi:hypothetical protein
MLTLKTVIYHIQLLLDSRTGYNLSSCAGLRWHSKKQHFTRVHRPLRLQIAGILKLNIKIKVYYIKNTTNSLNLGKIKLI